MKKLSIFFVLVLSLGLFLVPKYSEAQSTTDTTAPLSQYDQCIQQGGDAGTCGSAFQKPPTYTELRQIGLQLFIDARTKINSSTQITNVDLRTKVLTIIVKAEGVFTGEFKDVANQDVQANFEKALNDAAGTINSSNNGFGSGNEGTQANVFVSAFKTQLTGQANAEKNITAMMNANPGMTRAQALADNQKTQLQNATAVSNTTNKSVAGDPANSATACTGTSLFSFGCLDAIIADLIKVTLLRFVGFFLWMSAQVLDYSIRTGILNFSSWAPDALYPLWQMVRQIVSLCVIFAGLYMGFMYIVDLNQEFIKKYIPWLVIFALFVNFSLPISKAAIDISNVVALNIYAQAVGDGAFGGKENSTAGFAIMQKLGLQSLVGGVTGNDSSAADAVGAIKSTPAALLAIVMILYATYIFGFVALLMILRNVVLVFAIVFSPLLFISLVVPKFGEYAAKFRKFFFQQLAIAPVFMIMLYFSISVMGIFSGAGSSNLFSAASATEPNMAVFLNIIMMLGVLWVMLKVTRELSGEIGNMAEGAFKTVALGAATGGTAALGRATIGRLAARAGGSEWMDKMQGNAVGRGLSSMTNSIANGNFDVRNSSVAQKMAGMGGIKNFGEGASNKTYLSNLKEQQTKFEKKRESIQDDEARQKFTASTAKWNMDGKNITKGADIKEMERLMKNEADMKNYGDKSGLQKQLMFMRANKKTQSKMVEQDATGADEERRNRETQKEMDRVARETETKTMKQDKKEENKTSPIIVPFSAGSGPRKNHVDVGFNGNPKPVNQTEERSPTSSSLDLSGNIGAALKERASKK